MCFLLHNNQVGISGNTIYFLTRSVRIPARNSVNLIIKTKWFPALIQVLMWRHNTFFHNFYFTIIEHSSLCSVESCFDHWTNLCPRAPYKWQYLVINVGYFSLFVLESICCVPSSELSHWGTSDKWSQHMHSKNREFTLTELMTVCPWSVVCVLPQYYNRPFNVENFPFYSSLSTTCGIWTL